MANPTTNLSMTKPTVGGSTDTWGTTLNEEVVDVIDAVFSISGTDVTMSDIKFNSVGLQETGAGTDTVKFQAPAAVTQYTLTMPGAVGASGQILRTSDASGTLEWVTDEEGDLKSVADATNGGLDVTNGTGPDVTLAVDFNDLAAAVVDVAADSIGILDATDNDTKKETIADLVSAMGGTGLTGSSGQLTVDASQTQITAVGTIATGTWQGSVISGDYIDVTTSPLANTKIWIGDSSGDAQEFALSGDATMTAGGVVSVTAPAGDLTGTTLKSTVVSSSLTSVGTIATGVWNGTAISGDYIDVTTSPLANTKIWIGDSSGDAQEFALSGDVTMTAGGAVTVADNAITLAKLEDGTSGDILYYAASGVPTRLAKGSNDHILTLSGGLPVWAAPSATTVAPAGTLTGTTLASNVVTSSLTSTGALNGGSITSGFGAIDVGSSNIDGGTITADTALAVTGTSVLTGNVGIGQAASTTSLDVLQATTNQLALDLDCSHASTPLGQRIIFSAAAPDDRTQYFLKCQDSGANKAIIWSDGGADFYGNVGINTAAGARALNVIQATSAEEAGVFAHSHATNVAGVLVNFTGGVIDNRTKYFFRGMDTAGTKLNLWSDGGANFSGAVAIGTTSSPSADLDIGGATNTYSMDAIILDGGNGGLSITDNTKYLGFWATHGGGSLDSSTMGTRSNHALSLLTNDTKALTIDTSQNVGIGVTGPTSLYEKVLHIHEAAGSSSIHLTNNTTGSTSGDGTDIIAYQDDLYLWNRESAGLIVLGTNATDAMTVSASQDVNIPNGGLAIGTTSSPTQLLEVHGAGDTYARVVSTSSGNATLRLSGYDTNDLSRIEFERQATVVGSIRYVHAVDYADERMEFLTNGNSTTAMAIEGANVGIGTTSPAAKLDIQGWSSGAGIDLNYGNASGTVQGFSLMANSVVCGSIGMAMRQSPDEGDLAFFGGASATAHMTITNDGNVGIGTTSPGNRLHVVKTGSSAHWLSKFSNNYDSSNDVAIQMCYANSSGINSGMSIEMDYATGTSEYVLLCSSGGTQRFRVNPNGLVHVAGEITAGTKTFRIDHPLAEKKDTHHLVHSCLEGPKADLIYRGQVDLSGGYAQVDLDDAAGMSEGTWQLLCRDPQCWIQNDTGWSAVRGDVEGNTLTIECESTDSDDTVSWMVCAERQDESIKEQRTTDDDGHIIVEPEKEEEE